MSDELPEVRVLVMELDSPESRRELLEAAGYELHDRAVHLCDETGATFAAVMIGASGCAVVPVTDFHQLAALQRLIVDVVAALGRVMLIPMGLDEELVASMRKLLNDQLLSPAEVGHA